MGRRTVLHRSTKPTIQGQRGSRGRSTLLPFALSKMSFALSQFTVLLLYTSNAHFPPPPRSRARPTEFKAGYLWMPRTRARTFATLHAVQLHDSHPTAGTHARKFNGGRTLIVGTVFDVTVGRGFMVPVSTPQLPNSKGDSLSRWDFIGYLRAGKNNRSILFSSALSIADPIAAECR